MADDLLALADRLEKAQGRSPELGRDALLACGWRKTQTGYFMGPLFHWSPPGPFQRGSGFSDDDFHRHDPTAHLGVAMALVPKGWAMRFAWCPRGHFPARWALHPPGKGIPAVNDDMDIQAVGYTAAGTLTAAALRAVNYSGDPLMNAREITAQLTKAQREALVEADGGYLRMKHMLSSIVPELVASGLLPPRLRGMEQDNRLTSRGLEVRALLQEEAKP